MTDPTLEDLLKLLDQPSASETKKSDVRGRKPHIYIAGKISQSDYRHQLVRGLRNHDWDDGFLENDSFIYTGPFFNSCDHGCAHGRSSHGALEGCNEDKTGATHEEIIERNNDALDSADLVFVYITQEDCYGTLVEIGRASAKGKQIVIAFATGFEHKEDFWYAVESAHHIYHDVNPCCLTGLLAREIDRLSRNANRKMGGSA